MTASAYFPQREGQLKLPPLPPSSSDGDLGYLSNNSDGGVGTCQGQGNLHAKYGIYIIMIIGWVNKPFSKNVLAWPLEEDWRALLHLTDKPFSRLSGLNSGEAGGEAILAKFCHSCGTRFPISWARFCCMCGEKRLWMNPADKLPPIWSLSSTCNLSRDASIYFFCGHALPRAASGDLWAFFPLRFASPLVSLLFSVHTRILVIGISFVFTD